MPPPLGPSPIRRRNPRIVSANSKAHFSRKEGIKELSRRRGLNRRVQQQDVPFLVQASAILSLDKSLYVHIFN